MATIPVSDLRQPLVSAPKRLGEVTDDIARLVFQKPGTSWWIGFLVATGAFLVGVYAIGYEMTVGIGAWGLNRTVGWGFAITNFVFWIGIGHAGTLISAILFLFRQKWRTSINRSAEAMTIFAVMCAGVFPLIHMGRPWYFYWILPYPNNRGSLWVNFRSPLLWDFFAIGTYFLISLIFWYLGMVPDLATLRDKAPTRLRRAIFSFLCLGWSNSARIWHRYETIYALLAVLATPLVVSVHSIVSFDFCTSVVPGWHSTIFPPYFVAGAIFSGLAMVMLLLLVARKTMRLEDYITAQHFNWMCKLMLLAGLIVGFSYAIEAFMAWYSGNIYEMAALRNRALGPYAGAFWAMVLCNVVAPQVLWWGRARQTPWMIGVVCVFVTVGMWLERFVIIVISLHRDFLPSSWAMYIPTGNEVAILVGMFGMFFSLFLLFVRLLPVCSISEIKGVLDYAARPRSEGRTHD
ncbi:MAG: NrfD/PsrC family molybdoenzyme membrane anchor subunit [Armatimonadota bacterium]